MRGHKQTFSNKYLMNDREMSNANMSFPPPLFFSFQRESAADEVSYASRGFLVVERSRFIIFILLFVLC